MLDGGESSSNRVSLVRNPVSSSPSMSGTRGLLPVHAMMKRPSSVIGSPSSLNTCT